MNFYMHKAASSDPQPILSPTVRTKCGRPEFTEELDLGGVVLLWSNRSACNGPYERVAACRCCRTVCAVCNGVLVAGPESDSLSYYIPSVNMDDDICSKLMLISFDDDEIVANYDALSYTCGSEMFNHSISVNHCQVIITANPFEAIRHLRDKEKNRALWIDAIA